MPAFYRIQWHPDGPTQDFAGSRGNYYRLDDRNDIELYSQPVWCHGCVKVTHGERIESIQQIDQRIAHLEKLAAEIRIEMTRPPLPEPGAPGDRHQREQIAELQMRRAWRKQRRSSPRCLICGTTNIVPLENGKPVRIGNGSVQCNSVGLCSTYFNEWFFTPEGERIPLDTHPTYWHHPELDEPEHRERFQKWLKSLSKGDTQPPL